MSTQRKNARSFWWYQAQSGQAIVLIAFAMIALIGMLGLVVDGGGLFFLQRDAQNATDAAVIAATYARCTSGSLTESEIQTKVIAAGQAAAVANGFIDGKDGRKVTIQNPAPDSAHPTDNHYVQVDISATKPSYFIQLVFKGPLAVSTRAIGYCNPPFDPSSVKAIMGLASTCTGNTVKWAGSTGYIEGGVYSNNNMQFTGSDNTIDGGANAVTTVDNPASGNNSYSPAYTDTTTGANNPIVPDPLADIYNVDYFKPGGTFAQAAQTAGYYHYVTKGAGGTGTGAPYTFAGSTWKASGTLEGLYYVEGNASLGNNPAIGPLGITIVATGDITGNQLGIDRDQFADWLQLLQRQRFVRPAVLLDRGQRLRLGRDQRQRQQHQVAWPDLCAEGRGQRVGGQFLSLRLHRRLHGHTRRIKFAVDRRSDAAASETAPGADCPITFVGQTA